MKNGAATMTHQVGVLGREASQGSRHPPHLVKVLFWGLGPDHFNILACVVWAPLRAEYGGLHDQGQTGGSPTDGSLTVANHGVGRGCLSAPDEEDGERFISMLFQLHNLGIGISGGALRFSIIL